MAMQDDVEKVVGVIPNLKRKKGWFKSETVNLVFTGRRMIVAQLTSRMIQDESKRLNEQAKAEGKGFLSRMGTTAFAGVNFYKKYFDMNPEDIIREHADNYVFEKNQISGYKVDRGNQVMDDDGVYRGRPPKIKITAGGGKLEYKFVTGSILPGQAEGIIDGFMKS